MSVQKSDFSCESRFPELCGGLTDILWLSRFTPFARKISGLEAREVSPSMIGDNIEPLAGKNLGRINRSDLKLDDLY